LRAASAWTRTQAPARHHFIEEEYEASLAPGTQAAGAAVLFTGSTLLFTRGNEGGGDFGA